MARSSGDRTVSVGALARVEGEGAMRVEVRGGKVEEVELRIYEPPRFFEAFLQGRRFSEPPDITARICGICPVAYQMSACHALEDALGVTVDGQLRELRRLLYCGEWIESHVLHVLLLHAPDFLGYDSGISLAADHRELVDKGLQLKKLGNDIVEVVGGRVIHPVNVKVGGFYRVPTKQELRPLADKLRWGRDVAVEIAGAVAGFEFPDFETAPPLVSLVHPDEYPINEGRLQSTARHDFSIAEFAEHIVEDHVAHSNALHAHLDGEPYGVGPMARFALNYDKLTPLAKEVAEKAGVGPDCRNPFKSIVVRMVETVYACEEALRIIEFYEPPAKASVDIVPKAGIGHGCTEAPRGILYHRYELDDDGLVVNARITPPTAQNQATIEDDLRRFVAPRLSLPQPELTLRCEQAIRNYDPCISCATHFLRLEINHS